MGIIKKFRIKSFKNKNPIIEFENVSLSYGNRLILDNINFKINESEIFGMLGPNGVGKSTIFNLLTGLITPSSGKIKINGKEVNSYPVYLRTKKFKIGYVPQYGGYFGDLSLIDNLKAIGEIVIENKNLMNDRIDYLTSKFELENIKDIKLNSNEYLFHAGTVKKNEKVYAVGGRVLNFVSLSDDFLQAREKVHECIKELDWNGGFYRRDIGFKVIN